MPGFFLHLAIGKEETEQHSFPLPSDAPKAGISSLQLVLLGRSAVAHTGQYLAQSCQRELKSSWPEGKNDEFERREPFSPLAPPATYTSLIL